MNSSERIEETWRNYLLGRDSLKVVKSAYKKKSELLRKTKFEEICEHDFDDWYKDYLESSGDFCIVTLWAIFEDELIRFLLRKIEIIKQVSPESLANNLANRIENSIEYWYSKDRLDLIKSIVDPNMIGNAKQIKEYRDWIAHRRKEPSASVKPETAFKILKSILQKLDNV